MHFQLFRYLLLRHSRRSIRCDRKHIAHHLTHRIKERDRLFASVLCLGKRIKRRRAISGEDRIRQCESLFGKVGARHKINGFRRYLAFAVRFRISDQLFAFAAEHEHIAARARNQRVRRIVSERHARCGEVAFDPAAELCSALSVKLHRFKHCAELFIKRIRLIPRHVSEIRRCVRRNEKHRLRIILCASEDRDIFGKLCVLPRRNGRCAKVYEISLGHHRKRSHRRLKLSRRRAVPVEHGARKRILAAHGGGKHFRIS